MGSGHALGRVQLVAAALVALPAHKASTLVQHAAGVLLDDSTRRAFALTASNYMRSLPIVLLWAHLGAKDEERVRVYAALARVACGAWFTAATVLLADCYLEQFGETARLHVAGAIKVGLPLVRVCAAAPLRRCEQRPPPSTCAGQ